jgi:hypothetical protein
MISLCHHGVEPELMKMATAVKSERTKIKLAELHSDLESPTVAKLLWDTVLTDDERQRLGGDCWTAYEARGVIGTWQYVRGGDADNAIVELAGELGFITDKKQNQMLLEIGEKPSAGLPSDVPSWNPDKRELWYRGKIIRTIARTTRAERVIRILDAFEKSGWPCRVNDPWPGGPDSVRLHGAIRSLNSRLTAIKFSGDGKTTGIVWEPVH